MPHKGALLDLIARARRRHFFNLILNQAVNMVCVATGALILLLILGSEILDWPWVAAMAALGAVAAVLQLRKRIPSPYRVAQRIDSRLGLRDTLSTAFFYLDGRTGGSEEMRAAQLAHAERISATVDLKQAVPFAAPRSLYAMAALGLIASSLLGIRYGMTSTLDLRPPLPNIVLDVFRPPAQEQAKARRQKDQQRLKDLLKQAGMSLGDDLNPDSSNQDGSPFEGTQTVESREPGREGASSRARGDKSDQVKEVTTQTEMESGSEDSGEESSEPQTANAQSDSKQGEQQGSPSSRAANSQDGGLLDKFRNAMANLMSRLRNRPQDAESAQSGEEGARSELARQQRAGAGQQSAQGQGRQSSNAPADGDAEGEDAEGEGNQRAQSGAGKQGGEEAGLESSKEGKSGVGKEDGSKDLKEAEQLAAMGKISEIIGKRSAALTGEIMIEVPSGRQQLRTAYSQQAADHSDAGGQIHRDEVPLAFQRYVQQYFEEIRKPGAASARKQP